MGLSRAGLPLIHPTGHSQNISVPCSQLRLTAGSDFFGTLVALQE